MAHKRTGCFNRVVADELEHHPIFLKPVILKLDGPGRSSGSDGEQTREPLETFRKICQKICNHFALKAPRPGGVRNYYQRLVCGACAVLRRPTHSTISRTKRR